MSEDEKEISERMFDGGFAESELSESLYEAHVKYKTLGWDWYDNSLELHGVADDYRLSEEVQKIIYDAGFSKIYVNHENKWETHYNHGGNKNGWRVSYPHKRGENESGILVEEPVKSWPKEWFDTGYAIVKKVMG